MRRREGEVTRSTARDALLHTTWLDWASKPGATWCAGERMRATRSQRMGVTMSDSRVQPASRTLLAHICAGAERLPLISADERRCWPVMCWDTRPH